MQRSLSLAPGFVVGVSLAGFFDGIFLHQILQWHHMICIEAHCAIKTVDTLQRQIFADGLFHAAIWVVLVTGLALLVRDAARGAIFSQQRFWGAVLFGGGVFNVVEGIVDHHILQIHHVRFGPTQAIWDVGFLVVSAGMAVAGFSLYRQADRPRQPGGTGATATTLDG